MTVTTGARAMVSSGFTSSASTSSMSCSNVRSCSSAPNSRAIIDAVSVSTVLLIVIIIRLSSSFLRTSLTRCSSLSARSFTVMPSTNVMVRVTGGGGMRRLRLRARFAPLLAFGPAADGGRIGGGVNRGAPGRCWPTPPDGRMPCGPCGGRTGCDGSGRGPPGGMFGRIGGGYDGRCGAGRVDTPPGPPPGPPGRARFPVGRRQRARSGAAARSCRTVAAAGRQVASALPARRTCPARSALRFSV